MLKESYDVYMIAGALALVPAAFYMERRNKSARFRNYKRFGLHPVTKSEFDSWVDLSGFSILGKMGVLHRRFEYVMGEYLGCRIGMFALNIAEGTNTGVHQTVTVLEVNGRLPRFVLRPEWFRDKVKAKFGKAAIDFAEDIAFTRNFFIDGESETDIRRVFTDSVRRQLAGEGRLWIEADNERLVLFRESDFLVDGDNLEQFLNRATRIRDMFESEC